MCRKRYRGFESLLFRQLKPCSSFICVQISPDTPLRPGSRFRQRGYLADSNALYSNNRMKPIQKQQWLYPIITIAALVGFVASFLQLLEKLTLLKNSHAVLTCNLSSVFNCSNILSASQSSVFGFPNSLLCIILFTIAFTAGLVGWSGGKIVPGLRFFFQGLALFTLGFGLWYFWQSIFNVGSICIYCLFCFSGVLLLNGAWLRLNYRDYPLSKKAIARFDKWINMGADIFILGLIAAMIAAWALIKFA